ncbi:MAG: FimV/HubP family polar landmark protein [Steroidobacteraceae bacterium]
MRQFWWVIALAILALLAYFGLRGFASRRKSGFDDSLGRLTEEGDAPRGAREPVISESPAPAAARREAVREAAREGLRESARESAIVVEETGSHERPALDGAAMSALAARHVEADDTVSGQSAINLDQGDPLAEADFHMAYGLYDQAADLIRIAVEREPQRRDLKLKLLEVFFVWWNKEQFLQTARELASTRAESVPGEWDKVVIMGKQLAPEDPLFEGGGGVSGAAAGGVDLNLEGGQNRVDFDLAGAAAEPADQAVDLDIGTAIGERDPVAEAAAHQATDKNLALDDSVVLREDATAEREIVTATRRMTGMADGGGTGVTREMTGSTREMAARTVEMAASTREMTTTLEQDSWNPAELSQELEAPTVERPVLNSDHPPLRQKVEMALKAGGGGDHTAELALDDLGLDLDGLQREAHENAGAAPADAGLSGAADSPAADDAPTLVAGLDERSRKVMETAAPRAGSPRDGLKVSETGTWHFDEDPFASENGAEDGSTGSGSDLIDTSRLTALKSGNIDFEVDEPRPAQAKRSNGSGGLDLDVGAAHETEAVFAATQRLQADDLALPDLDPVTMSEVGTKLDLARAYMDMGDPEGARNILDEVLTEGSAVQKQEAERLIASLPG